jgi:hypothetical protein
MTQRYHKQMMSKRSAQACLVLLSLLVLGTHAIAQNEPPHRADEPESLMLYFEQSGNVSSAAIGAEGVFGHCLYPLVLASLSCALFLGNSSKNR